MLAKRKSIPIPHAILRLIVDSVHHVPNRLLTFLLICRYRFVACAHNIRLKVVSQADRDFAFLPQLIRYDHDDVRIQACRSLTGCITSRLAYEIQQIRWTELLVTDRVRGQWLSRSVVGASWRLDRSSRFRVRSGCGGRFCQRRAFRHDQKQQPRKL